MEESGTINNFIKLTKEDDDDDEKLISGGEQDRKPSSLIDTWKSNDEYQQQW